MSNTDTKQSAGYFKEKAIIGLSTLTGDEIDKAIMKVTSHMLKAPKEKYMQSLLAASYGHTRQYRKGILSINEYIVKELEKRSHNHNWIIVLKTLVVFHRLLMDGSDDIVVLICRRRDMFASHRLKELATSSSGAAQKYFIWEYITYLEERTMTQTRLGCNRRMEAREFDDYMDSLNASDLVDPFEAMIALLESLVTVNYREEIVDNFCTLEAYQNIIRDGKTVYQLLSKRIVFILNGFEDLSVPLKKIWLNLYKRFDHAACALKSLFDAMIRSIRSFAEPIPQLKPLPETLLTRLERVVELETGPSDEPEVATLESLGIQKEELRVDKEEEQLPPPPQYAQKDEKPLVSMPPTQAKAPAKPAFSMDDLFMPAPAQQPQPAAVQPGLQSQNIGGGGEQAPPLVNDNAGGWSTGAPAVGADDWSSGAPGGWSTGAPQIAEAQAPATGGGYSQSQGLNYYGSNPDAGYPQQKPPASAPQPPMEQQYRKKPQDPFQDLYNQSNQQWK